MALKFNRVKPGELITAQLMNSVFDALENMDARSGTVIDNNVAITSWAPAGDLRIGQEVTIFGRNFDYLVGAQRVYFNTSRVTVFKTGSGDSKLIIEIPDVPGVTEAGTQVTLTVTNLTSSDSRQVTLKPVQLTQQGNVFLSFHAVAPTTINVGATPIFVYNLESQAFLPATVTITPTISISNLQSSLQVLGANGSPLAGNQIVINPKEATQISIRLTNPIPVGVTSFNLTVTASSSGMSGSQDMHTFPIGTPIVEDNEVTTLAFQAADPAGAFSNNIISVAAGASATIILHAEFIGTDTRTYNLQVSVPSPATGWTFGLPTTGFYATPSSYLISGPTTKSPAFFVSPQAGATSPTTVEFTLQRADLTSKKSRQFVLQLA